MKEKYSLSDSRKMEFAGVFVLEYMINKPSSFMLLLEDNNQDLEPILEWLLVREYVSIENKEKYVPTEKGRECLKLFLARYSEFLNVFDIYCAVDLEEGSFAFSKYFEFESDDRWHSYLDQERWEDLRVAVACRKKIDPVEIVFMSFINEERFGRDKTGWQFDLLLGSVWDEILNICNTHLDWTQLGYDDEGEKVPAEKVIDDIISQGAELMLDLQKQESSFANREIEHEEESSSQEDSNDHQYVERVVIEEYPYSYYDPYLDPYYISPLWLGLWLI